LLIVGRECFECSCYLRENKTCPSAVSCLVCLILIFQHTGCPKSCFTEILSCDYHKMSNVH
jgi:hypothetical protein